MSLSRTLKLVSAFCEAVLGIPIIGGLIVIGFSYTPLVIMGVLHLVTLLITRRENGLTTGSTIGIVTSFIAWIPIIGMVMHIVTAILLVLDSVKKPKLNRDVVMIEVK